MVNKASFFCHLEIMVVSIGSPANICTGCVKLSRMEIFLDNYKLEQDLDLAELR
jgi:hypothetical protein